MGHRLHSDELSQAPAALALHPTSVSGPAVPSRASAPYAAKTRGYYQTLSASSVGLELAIAVIIGLFVGRWLDGQLGTTPWMMILWLGFGFTAGLRGVFRHVRIADKEAARNEAERRAAGEEVA